MCDLCSLNKSQEGFILAICKGCLTKDPPESLVLIVSREHRPEFTEDEKTMIKSMFPERKVRWEMRQIKEHAHAHILD